MLRFTSVLLCLCLISFAFGADSKSDSIEEQQRWIIKEVDHEQVYQACQELFLLQRNGKLSQPIFYFDGTTKNNELPETLNSLQPTYVHVTDVMVWIGFFKEGAVQQLQCSSNEFASSLPPYGNGIGLGWRTDPFGMDTLYGNESLDNLNKEYNHFELELIPGLTYYMYGKEESIKTLEDVKKSVEGMRKAFDSIKKSKAELAIQKRRLLHQTNHHELLKACRQIFTKHGGQSLIEMDFDSMNMETDSDPNQFTKHIDIDEVPKIISNLEPLGISMYKDMVEVRFYGGLYHCGFYAYMNDEENVGEDQIKLIDGLVYYDDWIRDGGGEYKKYLKGLKDEAVTFLEWQRKHEDLSSPEGSTYFDVKSYNEAKKNFIDLRIKWVSETKNLPPQSTPSSYWNNEAGKSIIAMHNSVLPFVMLEINEGNLPFIIPTSQITGLSMKADGNST
ncbi:MAG: hypothetical protein H8E62_08640, partial [Planctomycetes bacterium]|nr:hypothetical protein [Planctomycetota bacterium]